jgi:hypothetical protein
MFQLNRHRLEGMACGIVIGILAFWTALPLGYTTSKSNFFASKECGDMTEPIAHVFGRVVYYARGYRSCGPS